MTAEILLIFAKYVLSPLLALSISTLLTFLFRKQLARIIHEAIRDAVREGVAQGFKDLWGEPSQPKKEKADEHKNAKGQQGLQGRTGPLLSKGL